MTSYRDQLQKIDIAPTDSVSYGDFFAPPKSLAEAMRWMDGPGSVARVIDRHIDEDWTDECQGVAFTGKHWVFTSNGKPKRIFTMPLNSSFSEKSVVYNLNITEPLVGRPVSHVGAPYYHNGRVFVDHFNADVAADSHALVFRVDAIGRLSFETWFPFRNAKENERVSLIAIDPRDGAFYMQAESTPYSRVYRYDGSNFSGKTLFLNPPITDGNYGQGGAVSRNGHLYLATGRGRGLGTRPKNHHIYCYSMLNGNRLADLGVTAEGFKDELEGMCLADLEIGGDLYQIHTIMLDQLAGGDDVYFKSLAITRPESI